MKKSIYLINDNSLKNKKDIIEYKKFYSIDFNKFIAKLNKKSFIDDLKYDKYSLALVNINWFGLGQVYTLVNFKELQNFTLESIKNESNQPHDNEYFEYFLMRNQKDCPVYEYSCGKAPLNKLSYEWWITLYGIINLYEFMNYNFEFKFSENWYTIGFGNNIDDEVSDYSIEKLKSLFDTKSITHFMLDNDIFVKIRNANLYYKISMKKFNKIFTFFKNNNNIHLSKISTDKRNQFFKISREKEYDITDTLYLLESIIELSVDLFHSNMYNKATNDQIGIEIATKDVNLILHHDDFKLIDKDNELSFNRFSLFDIVSKVIDTQLEVTNNG